MAAVFIFQKKNGNILKIGFILSQEKGNTEKEISVVFVHKTVERSVLTLLKAFQFTRPSICLYVYNPSVFIRLRRANHV